MIGIFDSGLGGLTAYKELRARMPASDFVYFGDTGRVPYGSRSRALLTRYTRQDIRFLLSQGATVILAACGTVSSVALDGIRGEFTVPLIGVVDASVKAALAATKNEKIGVIGTGATISSGAFAKKIAAADPRADVISVACPMFVPLVENGYADSEVTRLIAAEYLEEMKKADPDTVILGCTHYPLLKKIIQEVLGDKVTLIDSGAAAADVAYEFLKEKKMLNDGNASCGAYRYFVSDSTEDFALLGGMFLEKPICESVEKVDIEKY